MPEKKPDPGLPVVLSWSHGDNASFDCLAQYRAEGQGVSQPLQTKSLLRSLHTDKRGKLHPPPPANSTPLNCSVVAEYQILLEGPPRK